MTINPSSVNDSMQYNSDEKTQTNVNADEKFNAMLDSSKDDAPINSHTEDTRSEKEIIEDMKALLKNIKSVIRTGFTEDELKAIRDMIDEIREKLRNGDIDTKEAEKLIKEVEQQLLVHKRQVTGGSTTKSTNEDMRSLQSNDTNPSDNMLNQLMVRLDKAMEEVNELEKSKLKQNENIPTSEELELMEMLKKNAG